MSAQLPEPTAPVVTGKIIRATAQLPTMADTAERAQAALNKVNALRVMTAEQYEFAGGELKTIKGIWSDIEAMRKAAKKPFDDRATEVQAFFAAPLKFLVDAEKILKGKLVEYSDEQDRLREEEQRKANAKAKAEQDRLQAIADEQIRIANEAAAAMRREAEAAAAAGRAAEAAKLEAQAVKVEEKAEAKAEVFTERASQVVAMVSDRAAPKVGGISIPKVWDAEIENPDLLPREYLMPNEALIRKVAIAGKGLIQIPGVRIFEKKRISAGRA